MDNVVGGLGSIISGRLHRYIGHRLRATAVWPSSGARFLDSQPAAARKSAGYGFVVQPDASGRYSDAATAGTSNSINDDAKSDARCPVWQYDATPARRV